MTDPLRKPSHVTPKVVILNTLNVTITETVRLQWNLLETDALDIYQLKQLRAIYSHAGHIVMLDQKDREA